MLITWEPPNPIIVDMRRKSVVYSRSICGAKNAAVIGLVPKISHLPPCARVISRNAKSRRIATSATIHSHPAIRSRSTITWHQRIDMISLNPNRRRCTFRKLSSTNWGTSILPRPDRLVNKPPHARRQCTSRMCDAAGDGPGGSHGGGADG
jgi:hypothetical protein